MGDVTLIEAPRRPGPEVVIGGHDVGIHNHDLDRANARLKKGKTYRDVSTAIIIPTRGVIPHRVVERLMGLMTPMNQQAIRLFVARMEVGAAYEHAFELVLNQLPQFKYALTIEEDNLVPPDGLLRLLESIDGYAAVGGLYWTKGLDGQPMIYGDPAVQPLNFIPQQVRPEQVQECNGLGMGFTLFDLERLRKLSLERPLFETHQSFTPGVGARAYTQDLFFFEKLRRAGERVACDTRVKVGHLDVTTGEVW